MNKLDIINNNKNIYGIQLLEGAGYTEVQAIDVTDYLVERCEEELKRLEPIKDDFVQVTNYMLSNQAGLFKRPW